MSVCVHIFIQYLFIIVSYIDAYEKLLCKCLGRTYSSTLCQVKETGIRKSFIIWWARNKCSNQNSLVHIIMSLFGSKIKLNDNCYRKQIVKAKQVNVFLLLIESCTGRVGHKASTCYFACTCDLICLVRVIKFLICIWLIKNEYLLFQVLDQK